MKECPAIIAALPRELKLLVKGWTRRELPGRVVVYTSGHAVAACAGMGEARAALAAGAAMLAQREAGRPVTALISAGLAGACDPTLRAGEIVRAGVVIDSRTGERFDNSQFRQVLVTAPAIASVSEKRRLFEAYQASAVDMEAAGVARMASAHGLYFQATKAISDESGYELEGLAGFSTSDGQFRETAFAVHVALRPALWGKVAELAKNSGRAVEALTEEMEAALRWYGSRE
jgi:adenosylhomocysteine nucleosidase